MESRFFTPVEFPELEEPEEEKPKEDPLKDVDITPIMTEIRRMIKAVETGASTITKGALILKDQPIWKSIEGLEDTPSVETLRHFLNIAEQDINTRFRREAILIFKRDDVLKKAIEENGLE